MWLGLDFSARSLGGLLAPTAMWTYWWNWRDPWGLEFVNLADELEQILGRKVVLATFESWRCTFATPRRGCRKELNLCPIGKTRGSISPIFARPYGEFRSILLDKRSGSSSPTTRHRMLSFGIWRLSLNVTPSERLCFWCSHLLVPFYVF